MASATSLALPEPRPTRPFLSPTTTTALKLIKEGAPEARYAARIALKLLADAKGDDYDLTTFRYEMINHIQKLRAFEAK